MRYCTGFISNSLTKSATNYELRISQTAIDFTDGYRSKPMRVVYLGCYIVNIVESTDDIAPYGLNEHK